MAFSVDLTVSIAAPPALVWTVITDLPKYPEWNPFVVSCRSTLVAGDPILMKVRLFPWLPQYQQETVFEHVPGERLCYGLDIGAMAGMRSRRCHHIAAEGADRTGYRSEFLLDGWLSPVVAAVLGRRLEHGFRSMTDAIRTRAESLHAASAERTGR